MNGRDELRLTSKKCSTQVKANRGSHRVSSALLRGHPGVQSHYIATWTIIQIYNNTIYKCVMLAIARHDWSDAILNIRGPWWFVTKGRNTPFRPGDVPFTLVISFGTNFDKGVFIIYCDVRVGGKNQGEGARDFRKRGNPPPPINYDRSLIRVYQGWSTFKSRLINHWSPEEHLKNQKMHFDQGFGQQWSSSIDLDQA